MNEKLIFTCTWGREEPERATLPFVAANVAAVGVRARIVGPGRSDIFQCKSRNSRREYKFQESYNSFQMPTPLGVCRFISGA